MTLARNMLTFQCPYCGHKFTDDYECIVSGKLHGLRCEQLGCRQQFSFLIRDCLECGEESVFTWKSMPAAETLALLSCNQCGAPFNEPAPEDQSPNPARRI